jgi:tetratricopeptide (TPR) repeat protein
MSLGEQPVESRPDERWFLTDQREFLLRSLEDAAREHEAGDLSDEDHAVLVARDSARLAEVEAELAALGPATTPSAPSAAKSGERAEREGTAESEGTPEAAVPRGPMPQWRKLAIVACCLLIVLGAGLLLTHFLQSAQPGQPLSGSITQSQQQQIEQLLNAALQANNRGDVGSALNLYDQVLSEDPSDPNALAYAGYLQWNIGSKSHVANLIKIGRAEIEKAVQGSPSNPEGHLFYGLVLANQDHDDARAVEQFNDYLADGPPVAQTSKVSADVAPSYQAVGQPLPPAFGATAPSSTAPSSTTTTSAP